ncbi:MAG: Thiamine-phosphate diphosphorylase [Pseudomonadota bacterium]
MSATPAPRLIAISDGERAQTSFWIEQLERLLSGARPGTVAVLLRDRQLPIRERLQLGQCLRQLTQRFGQALLVNDRLDLACLLQADGVHLSEASVTVEDARELARAAARSFWISAACHDPDAFTDGTANALLLSPLLEARKQRPALGLAGLERALAARSRRSTALPPCAVYALGGVRGQDAGRLLGAGADGVALIGELFVPGSVPGLLDALVIRR